MKNLINVILALVICGAFLTPVYAEEYYYYYEYEPEIHEYYDIPEEPETPYIPEIPPETTAAEPVVVTLPSAVTETSETCEFSETEPNPYGYGMIETPNGNAKLLEDVNDNEVSRQFITVQSKGGNIFYIIIDRDGDSENVYFLNAVDDFDLLSFSENFPDGGLEAYEGLKEEAAKAATEPENDESEEENQDENPVEVTEESDKSDNADKKAKPANKTTNYIIIGICVLFLLGVLYFKVIKPKIGGGKNTANYDNDDYYENDDDEEYYEEQPEIQEQEGE